MANRLCAIRLSTAIMAYTPKAYPKFNKIKKKLPSPLREEIDKQVDIICANPLIAKAKTGDLKNNRIKIKVCYSKFPGVAGFSLRCDPQMIIYICYI